MAAIEDIIHEQVLNLDVSNGPQKVLELLERARNTELVRSVCLSRNFPSPRRALTSEKNLSQVLKSIVALPKVTHLKVSYASGTFPIHLLVEALANHEQETGSKSSIDSVFFLGVKLAYSETLTAARIIKNVLHLPLRSISLENCMSESLPNKVVIGSETPFATLVSALSQIVSLERLSLSSFNKVYLQNIAPFPWLKEIHLTRLNLCETSVQNISQSPQLVSLSLDSMLSPSPQRLLLTLARTLSQPSTIVVNLRKLRVVFTPARVIDNDDEQSYNEFWEMLQTNNSLHDLIFFAKGKIRTDDQAAAFGIPIAEALQHNSTLQRLNIHIRLDGNKQDQGNLEKSLMVIANSLRFNQTLKHFSFHLMGGPRGLSERQIHNILMDPFGQVLLKGEQYVLETLLLEYRSSGAIELSEEMQFQLALNRAGRHRLLFGNATQQDWTNAVVANQSDISIIFFFLSRDPLLCRALLGIY